MIRNIKKAIKERKRAKRRNKKPGLGFPRSKPDGESNNPSSNSRHGCIYRGSVAVRCHAGANLISISWASVGGTREGPTRDLERRSMEAWSRGPPTLGSRPRTKSGVKHVRTIRLRRGFSCRVRHSEHNVPWNQLCERWATRCVPIMASLRNAERRINPCRN